MRLTLRRQITTALVLFGLVPAAVVAAFAWQSNEDYKNDKKVLVKQAARYINARLVPLSQTFKDTKFESMDWVPHGEDRQKIEALLRETDEQYRLRAKMLLVNPNNKILARINESGVPESIIPGDPLPTLDLAYGDVAKTMSGRDGAEENDETRELVGFSPVQFPNAHGYTALAILPKVMAYSAIYSNQASILWVLGGVLILTVLLGFLYGGWFVRPLLEIIQVTHGLQDGQLFNRTKVKRKDELGLLAKQVNSVVDKWSELISQIRTMTGSVTTASKELDSSAYQLAQGSSQQAATLQQIAGTIQSVNASVGRNAQHAKDTARMANDASSQAEKGGEAVRETVVAMREIAQKILVVERHRLPDEPAGAQRGDRGGAGRDARQGVRGGRRRGPQAGRAESGRRATDQRPGQEERRRRRERRQSARPHGPDDPRHLAPDPGDRRRLAGADGRDPRDQHGRQPARGGRPAERGGQPRALGDLE